MSVDPRIDKIFEQWKKPDSPGMAIAVKHKKTIVHRAAYGMADLDADTPNAPDTVFFCASLAKQFTAMSILLLSDEIASGERKINLDEDVRTYIDELNGLENIPEVTIRQLLHHTSGIRDMLIQFSLRGLRWGDDDITRDDVLWLVSRMKTLNFTPGSRFAYSNTNFFLAGEIVAKVSGMPLSQFAQEKIFGPLNMTSSRFVDSYREPVANRASGYRKTKSGQGFEPRMPNYDFTGPTNLFTTVDDLLQWHANFDPEDNLFGKVGGEDGVKALQQRTAMSGDYGLGTYVLLRNGEPEHMYHDGRTIGHRAHLFRDHLQRISIALLCNVEFSYAKATHDIVYAISEIVQGNGPTGIELDETDVQLPPGTRQPTALNKYSGTTYYNDEIDATYKVNSDGASLVITRPEYPDHNSTDHKLTDLPGSPDNTFFARQRFTVVLRETQFTFVGDGDITDLQLDWSSAMPRIMNFRFRRLT